MKEVNASIAIQVLPDVKNNDELIKVVDEVISYIKSKNLKTHVGPFETTIEGNYEELMEIIKECHIIAIKAGAEGLMSYIKVNYKPKGDLLSIDKKLSKYN
ncbi:MAG: thiamine-binding protein [Fusobacterium sp.]|uniref:thiamine-binding protein n=1 Tax=Fusobacterium sp. TaxID=68766 RepID=UPI0026DA8B43|nr:thiamine-binding protein [Fusobacterium sp.]MDO4690933.1 thiamine-binding protein [Fusobacterium sp.]